MILRYLLIICLSLHLINCKPRLSLHDTTRICSQQTTDNNFFHWRRLSESNLNAPSGPPLKTVTIHGSSAYGYYFTTLHFGTPTQPQTLIIDTGSSVTTIPCKECGRACGRNHFNKIFEPTASSTYMDLKCGDKDGNYVCERCYDNCGFDMRYSEGSQYYGKYKKDYIRFEPHTNLSQNDPNDIKFLTTFGCTLKETNLFLTQDADGIMGLGVKTNSKSIPPSIVNAAHQQNVTVPDSFSICMGPQGGYMTFGGYNTTHHDPFSEVKYVHYDGAFGQYRIHWKSIKFDDQELPISEHVLNANSGAYVDSGTTLIYSTPNNVGIITGALTTFCEKDTVNHCGGVKKDDGCWLYDPSKYATIQDFYATFRSFTFRLGYGEDAFDYELSPENYLVQPELDSKHYCLGIMSLEGGRTILGGVFMKNHDVLFDRVNQRIGLVKSDCSADYSLDSFPKKNNGYSTFERNVWGFIEAILIAAIIFVSATILVNCWQKYRQRDSVDKYRKVKREDTNFSNRNSSVLEMGATGIEPNIIVDNNEGSRFVLLSEDTTEKARSDKYSAQTMKI